ncbi:protein obstructor-E-like [Sabethes cyaneus]|uniref:protein obstructor-E-like n=1 Tax=Sabethes cyaneus TaxID=53552 RepID=UPI00237E30AB|nr:protein obstructor-E-like [Sabethes cyaneus]
MKPFLLHTVFVVTLLSWLVSTQEAPSPADSVCNGIIYATLPDPVDCRSYYVCIHSKGTHNTCPHDFVFQPSISFCVHRTQYRCPASDTTTSTTTTTAVPTDPPQPETQPPDCPETSWEAQVCRNHLSALIPNSFNCTQYVNCESNPPRNQQCPPGRIFSLPYQDCLPGNQATCTFDRLDASFCAERPSGSYSHPYQCNRFVTCLRGEPRVETCPPYYLFDGSALRCVRGDVLQCSSLLAQ